MGNICPTNPKEEIKWINIAKCLAIFAVLVDHLVIAPVSIKIFSYYQSHYLSLYQGKRIIYLTRDGQITSI